MYCSDCGRLVCACPGEGVIRCRYGRPAEILAVTMRDAPQVVKPVQGVRV